jgi:eukaryotic-like serine/threonine-protein kinase
MKSGELLRSSYRLEERLGKSPYAETWAAATTEGCTVLPAGSLVVIKILALGDMPDWKGYESFEREAAALKALRHPAIPRYVDSFRLDEADGHRLCLVMERMPGRSLAAELESGRRWTEAEIEALFVELLSILAYLQALRPPIIHRDINPKNLIVRPDGSLALVDFSGVQDAVRLAYRDSFSMMGSAGYAPLEQISGRAGTRSDLYAAAATMATLLTRTHPSDLPRKGLRIDPGALVELSPRLLYVLENYLDPDEERRDLPIAEAVALLKGERDVPGLVESPATGPAGPAGIAMQAGAARPNAPVADEGALSRALGKLAELAADRLGAVSPEDDEDEALIPALPTDSKVRLRFDRDSLSLAIPRGSPLSPGFIGGGIFAIFWLGFVAFWTFMAIAMGAPLFFPLFSLPFWAVGIGMARAILKPVLSRVDIEMTREGGVLVRESFMGTKTRHWPLEDLGSCRNAPALISQKGRTDLELVLELGTKTLRFGSALSNRERTAIARSVNAWRKGELAD